MEVFVVGKCGFIDSCTRGKGGLTSVTLFFLGQELFSCPSMEFLFKNRAENSSSRVPIYPVIAM